MEKIHYYTAAATRELDRLAIEEYNIPGFELMQRAGKAAFHALLQYWPDTKNLIILCGTGNNGGDGFIIAGLAKANNLQVELFVAGEISSIKGDALKALDYARKQKVVPQDASKLYSPTAKHPTIIESPAKEAVLVDALLGTGLKGNVREPYTQLISAINSSKLSVLAVDIPSGLCSDTGEILGNAVKADLTVTFIGRKIGLVSGSGVELTGELIFDGLNVPNEIYARVSPAKPEHSL